MHISKVLRTSNVKTRPLLEKQLINYHYGKKLRFTVQDRCQSFLVYEFICWSHYQISAHMAMHIMTVVNILTLVYALLYRMYSEDEDDACEFVDFQIHIWVTDVALIFKWSLIFLGENNKSNLYKQKREVGQWKCLRHNNNRKTRK